MKKEDFIEYYPNGCLKHKIYYYDNGSRHSERFYDINGNFHREGMPALQEWYENGVLVGKIYCIHHNSHNISNPAYIRFKSDGKIWDKRYMINDIMATKIKWKNKIKNC